MANSKPHSARKRLISNVYSKSHLQSSQDMHTISQILLHERFLPILESAASSGSPIDVHELNFAAAMDFINAYIFGLENGSNFLEDVAFRKHFLDLYHSRKTYTFWPQELPKVTSLLHILGIRVVPKFVDAANREIERWCLSMCMASKANVQTSDNPSNTATPSTRPVVYSQLAESLQQPSTQTTDKSASHEHDLAIASELLDELAAGHETSGITLTYLMHELSQRPNLQANLREELLTLSPSLAPSSAQTNIPSSRALDALPLLHALLLETLRLHAAIPGPQPRVTPSTPTTLAGYDNIPPHTRVSALAYTLHRNATVFPDPLAWKPERWLEADKEQKEEMMRWFWAFGSGGRMCIGSNFAMQEMKLLIAAIYTNFTTSIVDDDGIEQEDAYTAGPTGNRLILRFERVD
ncbi:hypothetical protein MMC13_002884 [Lambiella insularis]|nr:hypothetical protein [Lambiella insularis]